MNFFSELKYLDAKTTALALKEAVSNNYLVHVANYNFDVPVDEFYSHVAETIGTVMNVDEDIKTGEAKQNRWIDISYDPEIPDRYRSSNTRQPLHTDDSYVELGNQEAVNFFYCTSQAKMGGATIFLPLDVLIDCLMIDGRKELLDQLMTTDVIFSKSSLTKTRKILDKDSKGYLCNWNYFCIDRENNSKEVITLCETFHHFLETRVVEAGLVKAVTLKPGEAVFFHDDRVIHGRNAFFVTEPKERCLIKGKVVIGTKA
ncbi:MAG: TauD/TfdA family dioxygenase [Pseudarcicella sp.]|jgi:alpha-ketoglutarate-dependent taurine dioxygenase|nr:TauD/TfdA family dioxygenase [Pseudarcicella sp.]MBP6411002.1 TauD/TfdA family dioxygenase [Pseudarcicella sp.]